MTKTYKSKRSISINVVLDKGKNCHISFLSMSDGSSVYSTENEELQKAIERHYQFGKMFNIDKQKKPAAKIVNEKQERERTRKVTFSDIASAKEYLADTFGVSRTQMKSEKSIVECGKSNGIEIVIEE